jgi:hypothetical protein
LVRDFISCLMQTTTLLLTVYAMCSILFDVCLVVPSASGERYLSLKWKSEPPVNVNNYYHCYSTNNKRNRMSDTNVNVKLWKHEGEWSCSFSILYLGTRWRWLVSFTPRPLYTWGNLLRYPLNMRLCGPQSRSGHRGGAKKFCLYRDSNFGPSVVHPVASGYTDRAIPAGDTDINKEKPKLS